jgi:D-alanyl-D-alanine carboxypeptidase
LEIRTCCGVNRRASARSPRDEIPLARRTRPPAPPRPSPLARGLRLLLAGALAAGVLALLLAGPLRHLIEPPPVAGLHERLSADGRLLGHFPYPEAEPGQLTPVLPGIRLRSEAGEALLAMRRAAAAEGIDLAVLSGYRDAELQRELFFDVKSERNQSAAQRARVSAPPGFSEHSTGYAVDLGDAARPGTHLSPSFDGTPAFRWLAENAARHHFHLSFPEGNAQGVNYEPWHWRYEGSTEALQLFEPAQRLRATPP